MASPALPSSLLLVEAKNTLEAAQILMKKSDPDAQRLNQISEKINAEVASLRKKFDYTLQYALQQQFVGNVPHQLVNQLTEIFEAYDSMRDAFGILRITASDQQYINKQNDTFYRLLIDKMHSKLMQLMIWLVQNLSSNIYIAQTTFVLETFRKSVNHVKDGALENWRREQKLNIVGIRVKPDTVTEAMDLLLIAQKQFRDLMNLWRQIAHIIGHADQNAKKAAEELEYLLQRNHNSRHSDNGVCRKKVQPPSVISKCARVDEDKVTVIPKLLAVSDEGCPNIKVRFKLEFIRPVGFRPDINSVTDEVARKLRENKDGDTTNSAIERGGKLNDNANNYFNELSDVGKYLADGSFGFEFKNVTLDFDKKRSATPSSTENQLSPLNRKTSDKRKADKKYHMHLTAQINIFNDAKYIELKTISTPFMISVNGQQYCENSRAMLWSTLASASNSVAFNEEHNATVPWGKYGEAIKWMFYKETMSRELRDDEVDHIGYQIFKLNHPKCKGTEFQPSPLMQLHRGHIQDISTRHAADTKRHADTNAKKEENSDAIFSFWDWYFNSIKMIDDRNSKLLPTEMATTDPRKKDWRTMAGLFRAGSGKLAVDVATLEIWLADPTVDSIEHVPLGRQDLLKGLPALIAKLTQIEGIEELVVGPRHCVKKQHLTGSLGPTIMISSEYVYNHPHFKTFTATDRTPSQPQPQRSPFSDDQLHNAANALGLRPESVGRLASVLQENLCVKDMAATAMSQPAAFFPPNYNQQSTAVHFTNAAIQPSNVYSANTNSFLIQQSPDQQYRTLPPCQIEPPQNWNGQRMRSSGYGIDDSAYASARNFNVYQQPTGQQAFQNGVFSAPQMFSGQQQTLQPMLNYQSQQPHFPMQFHDQMEESYGITHF